MLAQISAEISPPQTKNPGYVPGHMHYYKNGRSDIETIINFVYKLTVSHDIINTTVDDSRVTCR